MRWATLQRPTEGIRLCAHHVVLGEQTGLAGGWEDQTPLSHVGLRKGL